MDQRAANIIMNENVGVPIRTSTETNETSVDNEITDNIISGKQKREMLVMMTRQMNKAAVSLNTAENVNVPVETSTKVAETSVTDKSTGNIASLKRKRNKSVMVTRKMDQEVANVNVKENVDVPVGTNPEITETSVKNESTANVSVKQKRKIFVMATRKMDYADQNITVTKNIDFPVGTSTGVNEKAATTDESDSKNASVTQKRKKMAIMTRQMDQASPCITMTENVRVSGETRTDVKESMVINEKSGNIVSAKPEKSKSVMITRMMLQSMLMHSLKTMEKKNGATFEDLRKYMKEKYPIYMKEYECLVKSILQKSVENGVLEKIDGTNAEGRFKIKKSENLQRDLQKTCVGKRHKHQ